jgi:hypothetical protein
MFPDFVKDCSKRRMGEGEQCGLIINLERQGTNNCKKNSLMQRVFFFYFSSSCHDACTLIIKKIITTASFVC